VRYLAADFVRAASAQRAFGRTVRTLAGGCRDSRQCSVFRNACAAASHGEHRRIGDRHFICCQIFRAVSPAKFIRRFRLQHRLDARLNAEAESKSESKLEQARGGGRSKSLRRKGRHTGGRRVSSAPRPRDPVSADLGYWIAVKPGDDSFNCGIEHPAAMALARWKAGVPRSDRCRRSNEGREAPS